MKALKQHLASMRQKIFVDAARKTAGTVYHKILDNDVTATVNGFGFDIQFIFNNYDNGKKQYTKEWTYRPHL